MITTECEKLRDLLRGLEKAKANKRVVESLAKCEQDLVDLRDKAKSSFQAFEAMNKRETVPGTPNGTKAQSHVAGLRTALKTDPESITKGHGFTNMRKAIDKIAVALDTATKEAWKDYLAKSKPKLDANQLSQARQMQAHKADVVRLEELDGLAKRAARKPPADEEAFASVESQWESIRDLIKSIPSPNTNPEIQAFLEATNTRDGASIELMTEEVIDWLKKASNSKKFRVHQA